MQPWLTARVTVMPGMYTPRHQMDAAMHMWWEQTIKTNRQALAHGNRHVHACWLTLCLLHLVRHMHAQSMCRVVTRHKCQGVKDPKPNRLLGRMLQGCQRCQQGCRVTPAHAISCHGHLTLHTSTDNTAQPSQSCITPSTLFTPIVQSPAKPQISPFVSCNQSMSCSACCNIIFT
jgi:hypothetical protein